RHGAALGHPHERHVLPRRRAGAGRGVPVVRVETAGPARRILRHARVQILDRLPDGAVRVPAARPLAAAVPAAAAGAGVRAAGVSDLFAPQSPGGRTDLAAQACVLHGFALAFEGDLLDGIDAIAAAAPFRHLVTPGGHEMQVAMTNCGTYGWCSDRRGYCYDRNDPRTGRPWPAFP